MISLLFLVTANAMLVPNDRGQEMNRNFANEF